MNRFCEQCGMPINDDAVFCNACGKPIKKIPDGNKPIKDKQPAVYNSREKQNEALNAISGDLIAIKKKKTKQKILSILIPIVAVCLIAVIVVIIISGKKPESITITDDSGQKAFRYTLNEYVVNFNQFNDKHLLDTPTGVGSVPSGSKMYSYALASTDLLNVDIYIDTDPDGYITRIKLSGWGMTAGWGITPTDVPEIVINMLQALYPALSHNDAKKALDVFSKNQDETSYGSVSIKFIYEYDDAAGEHCVWQFDPI